MLTNKFTKKIWLDMICTAVFCCVVTTLLACSGCVLLGGAVWTVQFVRSVLVELVVVAMMSWWLWQWWGWAGCRKALLTETLLPFSTSVDALLLFSPISLSLFGVCLCRKFSYNLSHVTDWTGPFCIVLVLGKLSWHSNNFSIALYWRTTPNVCELYEQTLRITSAMKQGL